MNHKHQVISEAEKHGEMEKEMTGTRSQIWGNPWWRGDEGESFSDPSDSWNHQLKVSLRPAERTEFICNKGAWYLKITNFIYLEYILWTEVVVWLYEQGMEEDGKEKGNGGEQLWNTSQHCIGQHKQHGRPDH